MAEGSGPRPSWREAIEAEQGRRRRPPGDQRRTLRRLTVTTAVAAVGLNAVLFAQTGIQQVGLGDFQDELVSALGSLYPTGGLRPASQAPAPSAPGTGVVTTGSS